jgi:glycosyltransferase involved in cell wall biosynthesis
VLEVRTLIAHQSTIPHYRIPFYEALERKRPPEWRFEVVHDRSMTTSESFLPLDSSSVRFPLFDARSLEVNFGVRRVQVQDWVFRAGEFDSLIIEDAVHNLTYPAAFVAYNAHIPVVLWGHGRDRSVTRAGPVKKAAEKFKEWMALQGAGYFAYTPGVRNFLTARGLPPEKVHVLNNTLDIASHRQAHREAFRERKIHRKRLGIDERKVLLYVGRFDQRKRLADLGKAVESLRKKDPTFLLMAVGSGRKRLLERYLSPDQGEGVRFIPGTGDPEALAPIYAVSDLFVFPGDVGLSCLQALCYDLPCIIVDAPTHGPEIEYLSSANAEILPMGSDWRKLALGIRGLFLDRNRLTELRHGAWPSIKHLTIDAMADNFLKGVQSAFLEGTQTKGRPIPPARTRRLSGESTC